VSADLEARIARLLDAYDPARAPGAAFWGMQFDLGLAWVHHPEGEGGLGADRGLQAHVDAALDAAGMPRRSWRSGIALGLVAPTLAVFGSTEQKARHLRRIFTGEEIWCQLFSEPGAGSDIAGLSTRAVHKDGDWIVNGQKVWTSLGHAADWGILCARTDPDVPKHKGLTYFVVDMRSEGIDARPVRQITGEAEFDEVYLDDVVVPDANRVGEVGQGWPVTLTTLANERAMLVGDEQQQRGSGAISHVLRLWREDGDARPHLRDRVLERAVAAEALRITAADARAAERSGTPSSAWSFLKLAASELDQDVLDLALELMGPDGMTYDSYDPALHDAFDGSMGGGDVRREYLFARAMTIAGGTSQIQRTIIADRVLGLPREPAVDRDVPWREIPRA
jgi:alkylation response protein AidB-like acyl-CoA dehydrogenase